MIIIIYKKHKKTNKYQTFQFDLFNNFCFLLFKKPSNYKHKKAFLF